MLIRHLRVVVVLVIAKLKEVSSLMKVNTINVVFVIAKLDEIFKTSP